MDPSAQGDESKGGRAAHGRSSVNISFDEKSDLILCAYRMPLSVKPSVSGNAEAAGRLWLVELGLLVLPQLPLSAVPSVVVSGHSAISA